MRKLIPTQEEIDFTIKLCAFNLNETEEQIRNRIKQAEIEDENHKNEKCPKCKGIFLAYHHFVMCNNDDCPMKSKIDKRSLLDMWTDVIEDNNPIKSII